MRIVSWNIRAGGGKRATGIVDQLERWQPDVVALCEFRDTPPSRQIAGALNDLGLDCQQSTAGSVSPSANALLLASRWPLQPRKLLRAPTEPGRWLAAQVEGETPFFLAAMHIPVFVSGRKLLYFEAVQALATRWRHGPAMFIGDTNSGWPGLDEERPVFGAETRRWLDGLASLGWKDAFRHRYAEDRVYTWYSPNGGNGFRLDQAFVNRRLLARLEDVRYEWGYGADPAARRDALSDHAALILDLT